MNSNIYYLTLLYYVGTLLVNVKVFCGFQIWEIKQHQASVKFKVTIIYFMVQVIFLQNMFDLPTLTCSLLCS